jgi:hypothetical protein
MDADADEPDSALLELLIVPGKADQLPVAVRSPVAPVEDEHQGTLGVPPAQLEGIPPFVWQHEGRELPPTLMFTMDFPFR